MHIGVDATCWHNNRGYGRHARALLRELVSIDDQNDYTLFMDAEPQFDSFPERAELRLVTTSRQTTAAASSNGQRSLFNLWRMGRALADPRIDVLLFPTIYSYVPVFSRSKKIVMIHDVIAEKFPHLTLPRTASRMFWNAKVALGRRQASALVTVSEHSRDGIVDQFNVDPQRIFVVGEAHDPVFRRLNDARPTERLSELGICQTKRKIIYVGGFGPHKNLDMLVNAFAEIAERDEMRDVQLVLVGEYKNEVFHSQFHLLRDLIAACGLTERVIFTGYLPDDELVVLLNLSTVLVLPSLLEGFGLPAVEAAACGLPVIATTASPLPGLLGHGGQFVDPLDGQGWRDTLAVVLQSRELRESMSEAGLSAAGNLTWECAARQMMAVIGEVAA